MVIFVSLNIKRISEYHHTITVIIIMIILIALTNAKKYYEYQKR